MKLIHAAALTILAASLPMVVTIANADTVTLDTLQNVYPGWGGGEFTAYTSGPLGNYLNNYASDATYEGGFETFCVETGVEFSGGGTYYYTLGNVAEPLSGYPAGSGNALTLTTGAAWLYYEFGIGNLNEYATFDYTYGATRQAEDNLLQAAIWAFQGYQTYGSYTPATTANNIYYAAAINALGSADANSDYTGTYVQVLQMWSDSGDTIAAQNQLILTGMGPPPPSPTVPDGGMTVILLGGVLAGLQALRRKLFC